MVSKVPKYLVLRIAKNDCLYLYDRTNTGVKKRTALGGVKRQAKSGTKVARVEHQLNPQTNRIFQTLYEILWRLTLKKRS